MLTQMEHAMELTICRIAPALGTLALVLAFSPPLAGQEVQPGPPFEKLRSTDPDTRVEAAQAIAQGVPVDLETAEPILRPALRDSVEDVRFFSLIAVQVAASASEEGARSLQTLAPALMERLGDPEARVRAAAADALAMALPHTPARATGPLLDLLGDPDPAVRKSAVAALSRLGNPPGTVTRGLVKTLLEDPAAPVRGKAARALGGLTTSGPEVMEALLAGLGDPDTSVRANAANGLGKLGTDARPAVSALERLERDPNEPNAVRDQARYALRSIRDSDPDQPDLDRPRRPGH